jgi:hypothetical protein
MAVVQAAVKGAVTLKLRQQLAGSCFGCKPKRCGASGCCVQGELVAGPLVWHCSVASYINYDTNSSVASYIDYDTNSSVASYIDYDTNSSVHVAP